MSVSIRVEHITKKYGANTALNQIDLEIRAGEFICLLGPSGCGKSTLLRMIAGLDRPDEGTVYLGERDARGMSPAERNFGIVFQSYALFPNLTAFENVAYGLRNKKIDHAAITKRVGELLDMISLPNARDRYPAQLSGGEQQRVALARALAMQPDFLLLDEPLSALDAKVRQGLRRQIREIQRDLGLTTIMVTHDQDEALTMADRIVVMNRANLMQVGTPEEIYEHPVNEFVADFIGAINFIRGSSRWARAGEPGRSPEALLAIRPEKIRLDRDYEPGRLHAQIREVEFRGAYYRVSARAEYAADQMEFMVDVPFVRASQLELKKDEPIYLEIPGEEILYFERN